MGWIIAFVIVGALLILCAFTLFMVVYLKELAREEKIITSYSESLKNGFVDMPIVYLDKMPMPKALVNPAVVKDKKTVN
jgi:hypothetical protein